MQQLIFLTDDNKVLSCKNKGITQADILSAVSHMPYFKDKQIIYKNKTFNIDMNAEDKSQEWEISVYNKIDIDSIEVKIPRKVKSTAGKLYDYFKRSYEEILQIPFLADGSQELVYKKKFIDVANAFYMAGFENNAVLKFIRQHVTFGNYKGEPIYINYLFDKHVIQNYLLYLKGMKSMSEIWQKLDFTMSNSEKRKIKFYMYLQNWEAFTHEQKLMCMKLYKIYDTYKFNELCKSYTYENGFIVKQKIVGEICEENNIEQPEWLSLNKHNNIYLQYEYDKLQIKSVADIKG